MANEELKIEQENLSLSINRLQGRFEAINEEIKKAEKQNNLFQEKSDSLQKEIDNLESNLEELRQKKLNLEKEYQSKSTELNNFDEQINQKNLDLTEMEKNATERVRQEVESLQSEIDKLKIQRDDLVAETTDKNKKIDKLNEIVGTLNDSITILKAQEKDQKNIVDNETVNINELTKTVDKLKVKIEDYTNVLEVVNQDIKKGQVEITEFEDEKRGLITEITNLSKEREGAQKKFDELSLKSKILIERGEFQDGQAVYLKEQFEKIGRDYQPYEQ